MTSNKLQKTESNGKKRMNWERNKLKDETEQKSNDERDTKDKSCLQ